MTWLKSIWNIWWNQWTLTPKLITAGVLAVLVLALVFGIKSCGKKEVKIDHEAIQKVNSENKAEARGELREIVRGNLEVVEAVNERTALSDVNTVEQARKIDEKVAEADRKVEEAKAQKGNVTQEELKCILIPSNCS